MITVPITEQSGVAEARRRAVAAAQALGFNENDAGKVAIVVTELATNLVKHAAGGLVVIRPLSPLERSPLELLSIDSGPGMSDVAAAMRDGHSTSGTAGNGLGAIGRLSSSSEIHSVKARGTVIRAVCTPDKSGEPRHEFDIGCVSRPKPGEEVCGDAVSYEVTRTGTLRVLVSDGLGHGPPAAEASRNAVTAFHSSLDLELSRTMERLHTALRATRGAAAAVAEIDRNQNVVRYCGIGNIGGVIAAPAPSKTTHLISMNGIVGHQARAFRSFDYPWSQDAALIMHSDGISSRWDLDSYPGLRLRSSSVIAGVLYRDSQRTSDDATILVAKAE